MNKHANIEDAIAGLEQQIENLRSEAARLSSSVLPNERDLYAWRRRARHLYRDAGRYGRRESAHVADLIRENPGTASTATLAAAGLIGLGIWWLLSSDR